MPGFFKKYTDPTIAELRALKTEYGSEPEKWPSLDVLHAQLILLLMKMGATPRNSAWAKRPSGMMCNNASRPPMPNDPAGVAPFRLEKSVPDLVAAKESTRLMAMFNQCFPKNQPTRKNRWARSARTIRCVRDHGLEFFTQGDKPGAARPWF